MVITMPCVPGWKPNERRKGHRHGHHAAVCTCITPCVGGITYVPKFANRLKFTSYLKWKRPGWPSGQLSTSPLQRSEFESQVTHSLFVASAVATKGEKTLSSVLHLKHRSVINSSHEAAVPLCMGNTGVRGFSWSAWEDLLLKPEYLGLSSHRGSSFFYGYPKLL
jgi:hypothetical protein